jgi:hypothetical protein
MPLSNNIATMQRAVEAMGVRLVFDPEGNAAGILLRNVRIEHA